MESKKKLTFFIIALLITITLVSIPNIKADIKTPSFHLNDKWQYRGWTTESDYAENGTDYFEITVSDKTNITINGKKYFVWELERLYKINPLKSNSKTYYDVLTLKQRKTDYYEVGYWAIFPKSFTIWPIKEAGKKQANVTRIEYDGTKKETKSFTFVIEYIGNKTIETDVGILICHGVKIYKKNESQNYTTSYYSQTVGWLVKKNIYRDDTLVASFELTAYKTHNGSKGKIIKIDQKDFGNLPDYTFFLVTLIIILILVIIILFVQYERFKKK